MPAMKRVNVASTADALTTERFREVPGPAYLDLYASGVTAGDTISLSIGSRELAVDVEPNIEASADVVDTDRDAILVGETIGRAILHLRVVATTAINYLIIWRPVPGTVG